MGFLRDTFWPERSVTYNPLSWQQYQQLFNFQGNWYGGLPNYSLGAKQELPQASFDGYVRQIFLANPVVFACVTARMRLFGEARFTFRRIRNGRPGDFFGTQDLAILERPWPTGTTRNLLARTLQDVDIAGNFYAYRDGQTIRRMRPDWVSIVLGSNREPDEPGIALDAEVIGYVYTPGGYDSDDAVALLPEQVCHFAPIPDPSARFRGISWINCLIADIMSDSAATEHKRKFFEQGATVNLAVNFDSPIIKTQEQFDEMVKAFRRGHEGTANAFKTVFLAHGSSIQPIGANLQESTFREVQGAGETRICMAAGVPPIMIGASEGLAAATYSNYGQARRAFADLTMRPLWGEMAGAFAAIVNVPSDAELWYDDTNISFLQEDERDDAEILATQMQAIRTAVDGGFKPDTVVQAINAGDLSLLSHTGLYSVQLQPPTDGQTSVPASGNGVVPVGG